MQLVCDVVELFLWLLALSYQTYSFIQRVSSLQAASILLQFCGFGFLGRPIDVVSPTCLEWKRFRTDAFVTTLYDRTESSCKVLDAKPMQGK